MLLSAVSEGDCEPIKGAIDPGFFPVPIAAQWVCDCAGDPGFILHLFP